MDISPSQIDELLATLKSLLEQILPRRQRLGELEKQMAQVQQEYDKILGPHNAEADRLEVDKQSLRARLARKKVTIPELPPIPQPTQPPEVIDVELSPNEPPPPLPEESPRAIRKRALADHIYYFLDPSQSAIMQTINALLVDEWRDVGEMLEALAWGAIWAARAEWSTMQEQYERLEGWRQALEGRQAFWQAEEERLKNDSRYALWKEREARSHSEWPIFLQELAERQKAENERLANEVAILERAWQEKEGPHTAIVT